MVVALEHGGYIALPADYSRPNAEWDTLNDIEKRGTHTVAINRTQSPV